MKWPRLSLKSVSVLGPQYGANLRAVTPSGRGPRYVRITDIDEFGQLRLDTLAEPESDDVAEYLLAEGDLLLARTGATVGKTYRHRSEDGQCAFAGYLIRFRPNPRVIFSPFLSYYFQTSEYWGWIQTKKRVAAQPNINGAEYASLEIPVPSLREQDRIVELLDQADHLRRLSRNAEAKAARILPVVFLNMFGDPATNPNGWNEMPLCRIIESVEAGWSAQSEARSSRGGEMAVLKVSAVTSGIFRPEENKVVSNVDSSRTLIRPRRGDLLFSRANTRELVAATCIVDDDYPYLFLPDKLWRITPVADKAKGTFLKELFWQPWVRDKFRVASSGSSGSMLNISQDAMMRTIVPVPPFALQEKFNRSAWLVTETVKKSSRTSARIESTWNELLEQAFGGKLTAKWRQAHMNELLAEMAVQARELAMPQEAAI